MEALDYKAVIMMFGMTEKQGKLDFLIILVVIQ